MNNIRNSDETLVDPFVPVHVAATVRLQKHAGRLRRLTA